MILYHKKEVFLNIYEKKDITHIKLNKNSLNNRRNIIKLHSFSPFTFLFAFQQIFFYEYLSLK